MVKFTPREKLDYNSIMHSGECSASHDCIVMPTGNLYPHQKPYDGSRGTGTVTIIASGQDFEWFGQRRCHFFVVVIRLYLITECVKQDTVCHSNTVTKVLLYIFLPCSRG